jgi:hypothetical protein
MTISCDTALSIPSIETFPMLSAMALDHCDCIFKDQQLVELAHMTSDLGHPLGFASLTTVFRILQPGELSSEFHQWPKSVSYERLQEFKNELLKNPNLEEHLAHASHNDWIHLILYSQGIQHLKAFLERCLPIYRDAILNKLPFEDMAFVIRDNLEINPRLNAEEFAMDLHILACLVRCSISELEKIIKQVKFHQMLLSYPTGAKHPLSYKLPMDATVEDKLLIFFLAFFSGFIPSQLSTAVTMSLEACRKKETKSWVLHLIEMPSNSLSEKDFPETFAPLNSILLSFFLIGNYRPGDTSFKEICTTLLDFINRWDVAYAPQDKDFFLEIWKSCGDAIYGLNIPFAQLGIYHESHKILLDFFSKNVLESHNEAINHLKNILFDGSDTKITCYFAETLYKTYWYSQYLHQKPCALIDRLIDYHCLDLWSIHKGSHLSSEIFAHIIKSAIREVHPDIPFNSVRVWSNYHKLMHAHKKKDL